MAVSGSQVAGTLSAVLGCAAPPACVAWFARANLRAPRLAVPDRLAPSRMKCEVDAPNHDDDIEFECSVGSNGQVREGGVGGLGEVTDGLARTLPSTPLELGSKGQLGLSCLACHHPRRWM